MATLRRAYRWWHVRRSVLLSLSTLAVAGLVLAQALRLGDSPAIYAVSVLVTAQIALVTGYLLVRHLRREAPRESGVAAVLGLAAALLLTVTTPLLGAREQAPVDSEVVVAPPFDPLPAPRAAEPAAIVLPEVPPPAAPPEEPAAALPAEVDVEPATPKEAPEASASGAAEPAERPELELDWRLLENLPRRVRLQEDDPVRDIARLGVPSEKERGVLPPMHVTASLYLGHVRGGVDLIDRDEKTEGSLDELLGHETFETAAELLAEFPLSPNQVLRVSMIGMRTSENGILDDDMTWGGVTVPAGTGYEFELQWAHLFAGFTHRFLGYARESPFDLSAHLGVMIDHLSVELDGGGLDASLEGSDRGWVAPSIGLSFAVWNAPRGGLQIDLLQSLPVNGGGQTMAITDLRIVIQHDLSRSVSLLIGYRRVLARFRTFEDPVKYSHGETVAEVDVGGPLVGLDFRF